MTAPTRPEDLLPGGATHADIDGVVVRKGTIGAFLVNVRKLQGLPKDAADRPAIESELRASMPVLRSLGLLDVFRCRDEALAELLEA